MRVTTRLPRSVGSTPYSYLYSGIDNQLAQVAGPVVQNNSYDAAGHKLSDGVRSFTYDARGRMVSASTPSGVFSYAINGLGQRVAKYGSADSTYYAYDEAGHVLGEYGTTGAALSETVYLGDIPVAVLKGSMVYYLYADQINTPRVITDSSNTPVWRWTAYPFGAAQPDENPSGFGVFKFNLRFPGQLYDAETGLHYNYFRNYDPQTGRYVQSDPIGLAGGVNTFGYVENNPVNLIDLIGLASLVTNRAAGTTTFDQYARQTPAFMPEKDSADAVGIN